MKPSILTISTILASLVLTAAPGVAFAQEGASKPGATEKKKLSVGDRAPELRVESFLKGEEITGFEKGNVYVVEFWATWCGPCIQAMPHLSELARHYRDDNVTFIGTNVWEKDTSAETKKKVVDFIEAQGSKMDYTVVYDGEEKFMTENWMVAAGQRGIPAAFVVDQQGTIAYIGHPMTLDVVIAEVVRGNSSPELLQAKTREISVKMNEARSKAKTDPKASIAILDQLASDYPTMESSLDGQRMGIYLESGDTANATKILEKQVEKAIASKDSGTLNQIAWTLVDPQGDTDKAYADLALKAAVAADAMTEGKDPSIVDTLARVHFVKGDVAKAIELQTKAVELAGENSRMKASLEKALEEYKNHE